MTILLSRTSYAAVALLLTVAIGCRSEVRVDTTTDPSDDTTVNTPATDDATAPEGDPIDGDAGAVPPADESDEIGSAAAIGEPAPAWVGLQGTDDQQHSPSDLEDAAAVVVVFTCNSCPVAVAYEDRLIALAQDYESLGVRLVAINVNNGEADRLPAMKERAAEKEFNFAYLYDPSQEIARAYGATVTPHAFLLDRNRNIAYMGAIDDNQNIAEVSENHLRDAIDAVLRGDAPAVATTKQFGCGIKYE